MSEERKGTSISRREFIGTAATAAAGLTILPGRVSGGTRQLAPSDKLNIAGVGVGGMGRTNLENMSSENIVALCDVDWKYSQDCFNDFPDAKKYWDWRKMFDEMHDSIDAVVIATSDHTHATIAAHAMTLGKHVFLQKPLTHSVYESRLMAKLAKEYRVATQMGNQGASKEGVRQLTEWIWSGEIGKVEKVEAFTDRPIWPQGLNRPSLGNVGARPPQLGPVHRPRSHASVQRNLYTLELAWMVGLWNRRAG